jgi:integrase/recombinase XerD
MQKTTKEKINYTIKESITPFAMYCESNGMAESTIKSYVTDMKQFYKFVKVDLNNRIRTVDQIKRKDVELFKQHLLKKIKAGEMMPSTAEKKFSAFKVYFHFLFSEGYEDLTYGQKLGNKKTIRDMSGKKNKKLHEKILTDKHLKDIKDYLYSKNKDEVLRDRAFFEVLYTTGCRRSELINLKWENLNFPKREILIIRDKTSNESIIKLSVSAIDALRIYHNSKGIITPYIFHAPQDPSKPMPARTFNNIVNSIKKNSNLPDDFTSGWFRHTFITRCLKNGITPEKIIKSTGHSTVEALKPYTHLVADDMSDIADLFDSRNIA